MRKEVAYKLIDELMSGAWIKHNEELGLGPHERCCLGVLQEIAPSELPRNDLHEGYPSKEICSWAGIKSHGELHILIDLNDKYENWDKVIKALEEMAI